MGTEVAQTALKWLCLSHLAASCAVGYHLTRCCLAVVRLPLICVNEAVFISLSFPFLFVVICGSFKQSLFVVYHINVPLGLSAKLC